MDLEIQRLAGEQVPWIYMVNPGWREAFKAAPQNTRFSHVGGLRKDGFGTMVLKQFQNLLMETEVVSAGFVQKSGAIRWRKLDRFQEDLFGTRVKVCKSRLHDCRRDASPSPTRVTR